MNNELISVIVPVYNVEKYLRECIDSILSQTYSSFELILVDDGSGDSSSAICDEYAAIDKRIKVIHKENGGLSSARNAGLAKASGKYICFIDSDDFVTEDYLDKLYNTLIVSGSDVAFSEMESAKTTEHYELVDKWVHKDDYYILRREDVREIFWDDRTREYVLWVVACNKIFAKDFLRGFIFPEGRLHEDEFMINYIYKHMRKAAFVPYKLYNYRDNSGSITGSLNMYDPRHLDAIDAYSERADMAFEEKDTALAQRLIVIALYKTASLYKEGKEIKRASQIKYRELYCSKKKYLDIKRKMKYALFLYFPGYFCKKYV